MVVNQFRRKFLCKTLSMLKYKRKVWDLMDSFDAFNLAPIPREQNDLADLLAMSTTNLFTVDHTRWGNFPIEDVPCPKIPDNIEKIQVFSDDNEILQFMIGSSPFEA